MLIRIIQMVRIDLFLHFFHDGLNPPIGTFLFPTRDYKFAELLLWPSFPFDPNSNGCKVYFR